MNIAPIEMMTPTKLAIPAIFAHHSASDDILVFCAAASAARLANSPRAFNDGGISFK
jgi:hypothetical protein